MLLENHATALPRAIVPSLNVSAGRPVLLRIVSGAGTDLLEGNNGRSLLCFQAIACGWLKLYSEQ